MVNILKKIVAIILIPVKLVLDVIIKVATVIKDLLNKI